MASSKRCWRVCSCPWGRSEGGKIVIRSCPSRPLLEFADIAGELFGGPGVPVSLTALLNGLEPAVKLLAVRLSGEATLSKDPPEVMDFRMCGSTALQSEEAIVLSDP